MFGLRLNTVPQHVAGLLDLFQRGKLTYEPSTKTEDRTGRDQTIILGAQVLFGFQFNGAFRNYLKSFRWPRGIFTAPLSC